MRDGDESVERTLFQEEYNIIGKSLEMQEIVEVIQQVAPTDITVLITGESGVGKEIVGQAIHAASKRAHKPIVTVNCGAIPEGIIESELFGHEKGSFTGASDLRKGYFELADGGTIFLDEIGELPLATQVKFLRILENGEFMRVGSSSAKRVDVRVIAATNKDLEREVYNKTFSARPLLQAAVGEHSYSAAERAERRYSGILHEVCKGILREEQDYVSRNYRRRDGAFDAGLLARVMFVNSATWSKACLLLKTESASPKTTSENT